MAASTGNQPLKSSTRTSRTSRSNRLPPRLRTPWSLFLLVACLAGTALAQSETRPPDMTSSASLAPSPTRVSDVRETLVTADWHELEHILAKRKDTNDEEEDVSSSTKDTKDTKTSTKTTTSTTKTTKTTKTTSSNTDGSTTVLTISLEPASSSAVATSSPLPEPFDGDVDSEISSSSGSNCPTFLSDLLSSPSFEACYPLSLLIQTSRGFFEAEKQLLSIVRVLDATCAANVTYCTDYMNAAAKNLTSDANCKAEWNKGDSTVKEVLFGLEAYEMMYQATCLQTPSDDMYCFANAVTNLTTPSDAYFYYLPYNLTLPGSSVPSCSWCISSTMAIFHAAAADRSLPIANTYEAAAVQVNTICGPDFVNATLPKAETSSSHNVLPPLTFILTTLGAALLVSLL